MASKQAFSWTQPVCPDCWEGLKIKTGRATPLALEDTCAYCNTDIIGGTGFHIRVNPGSVPYPTITKDEPV